MSTYEIKSSIVVRPEKKEVRRYGALRKTLRVCLILTAICLVFPILIDFSIKVMVAEVFCILGIFELKNLRPKSFSEFCIINVVLDDINLTIDYDHECSRKVIIPLSSIKHIQYLPEDGSLRMLCDYVVYEDGKEENFRRQAFDMTVDDREYKDFVEDFESRINMKREIITEETGFKAIK